MEASDEYYAQYDRQVLVLDPALPDIEVPKRIRVEVLFQEHFIPEGCGHKGQAQYATHCTIFAGPIIAAGVALFNPNDTLESYSPEEGRRLAFKRAVDVLAQRTALKHILDLEEQLADTFGSFLQASSPTQKVAHFIHNTTVRGVRHNFRAALRQQQIQRGENAQQLE